MLLMINIAKIIIALYFRLRRPRVFQEVAVMALLPAHHDACLMARHY